MIDKELAQLKSDIETMHNVQKSQTREIEKLNTRMDEYESMVAFLKGNRLKHNWDYNEKAVDLNQEDKIEFE